MKAQVDYKKVEEAINILSYYSNIKDIKKVIEILTEAVEDVERIITCRAMLGLK
jgi:hypothetical protein